MHNYAKHTGFLRRGQDFNCKELPAAGGYGQSPAAVVLLL